MYDSVNDSWLIENARLIDPLERRDQFGRLLICHGKIAAWDPRDEDLPHNVERIDARGLIAAPGLVDIGTELGEPGREEDETIASGCAAALAGGFTSIACAANTEPPIDSAASVQFVLQKAAKADLCRVSVIGSVSKLRQGVELAEIGSLVEAGAVALSDAPSPVENTALMRRALEYCSMFNVPVLDHPEVRSLSGGGVMHEGKLQLALGLPPMPAEAEDLATARDLRLVQATGGRLHLLGISTIGSVELCRRSRAQGLRFTTGIFPANFELTDETLSSFDANAKLNPPLRSQDHIEACLDGLRDGTIDIISSGHRPRSLEKKMQELDAAPFGMIALETTLASVITHLVRTGLLTWLDAIAKLSLHPAQLLGLNAGSIAVGRPADLILIDPEAPWTVNPDQMLSRASNTPLQGRTLYGKVRRTFVGGRLKSQSHEGSMAN